MFSFEPQSSSFAELTAKFSSESRAYLRHLALGREVSTIELYFDDDNSSVASAVRDPFDEGAHSETVTVTTIDIFCAAEKIDRIDILKIDTEGFEMEVLFGAKNMIESGRISAIQFEFGHTFLGTAYHFSDVFKLLSPNYRMYRILRHGMVEVTEYHHDLEIYKIVNFMCFRRDVPV